MDDNNRTQSEMDRFYRQAINSLVAAAGECDKIAQGHSERVKTYAAAIAKKFGSLSSDDIRNIDYAASLHDIGKVAISCSIVNKLGKLTEEEFKIMREHSIIATRILDKVEGLHDAIPIIRHHHERFDGKGYPDGLMGEEIPIGARIVSVAETYDILTTDVPWRSALTKESALAEIEGCSGTQFDPRIVALLRETLTAA